jgi:myo-inositol-1(or 4)-monophosphatase
MTPNLSQFTGPFKEDLFIASKAVSKVSPIAIRDFHETSQLTLSKKGTADFVTMTDLKIEKELIKHLSQHKEQYGIISEEQGELGPKDTQYKWVIDPIDGTFNFMHGIPFFCISVALIEYTAKETNTILGVVYNPIADELFYAMRGQGGRHVYKSNQSKKLRASNLTTHERMLAAIHFNKNIFKEENKLAYNIVEKTPIKVRSFGSAALELAYLADSRINLVIYENLNIWDYAAGMLLVQEAGNNVYNLAGESINLCAEKSSLIASNRTIVKEILPNI